MMLDPINLFDFEARAKLALPNHIWDFIEAGASDEITTGRNRRALDAVALRPRYLVDVWDRDGSYLVRGLGDEGPWGGGQRENLAGDR